MIEVACFMSMLSDAPTADEDSGKERTPKGQTGFGRLLLGYRVKNTVTAAYLFFENQRQIFKIPDTFRDFGKFQGIRVERYH